MLLGRVERKPLQYYRFVDDIFGIWKHGEQSPDEFCEVANRIHPRIQVTKECSKDSVVLLDTRVKLVNEND